MFARGLWQHILKVSVGLHMDSRGMSLPILEVDTIVHGSIYDTSVKTQKPRTELKKRMTPELYFLKKILYKILFQLKRTKVPQNPR